MPDTGLGIQGGRGTPTRVGREAYRVVYTPPTIPGRPLCASYLSNSPKNGRLSAPHISLIPKDGGEDTPHASLSLPPWVHLSTHHGAHPTYPLWYTHHGVHPAYPPLYTPWVHLPTHRCTHLVGASGRLLVKRQLGTMRGRQLGH